MLVPIPESFGYPVLGALVLGESAGLPLPGETALIAAGGLAAAGHLTLAVVIATAVLAAVTGDTLGFLLGRRHGRAFLVRDGFLASHRREGVARADRFFAAHGTLTVFVSRFVPGVRVVAAVMAGAAQMPWPRFAPANALGALAWASSVASLAFLLGPKGAAVLAVAGFALIPLAAGLAWLRRWVARRRAPRAATPQVT